MSRSRKAGGSAFGLALVAMLVLGAFAASAAQAGTWQIEGEPFGGEAEFTTLGALDVQPSGSAQSLSCIGSNNGGIAEFSYFSASITLKCEIDGWESTCDVKPELMEIEGSPEEPILTDSVIFETTGKSCPWASKLLTAPWYPMEFSLAYGSEAVGLGVTVSADNGGHGATISGPMSLYLTQGHIGDAWGLS